MYSRRFCINITQHDSYDCEKGVTNLLSIEDKLFGGGCLKEPSIYNQSMNGPEWIIGLKTRFTITT